MTLLRRTGAGTALFAMWCAVGVLATSAAADTRVSAQLGEALERYVRERADASVSQIDVPELTAFDALGFSPDELDVSFRTRTTGSLSGRTPVTVILNHAGREVKRSVVTVGLIAYKNIYIAARAVGKGEVVDEGDIRRVRRDVSTLRGAVVTRSRDLLGMRVRRSIPEGRAWQPRYLETVPVVRRGELVRLRLESGGLRIDGTGKAGADGRAGEFIRVLNAATKRYVTGRVDEEGTVHVRF